MVVRKKKRRKRKKAISPSVKKINNAIESITYSFFTSLLLKFAAKIIPPLPPIEKKKVLDNLVKPIELKKGKDGVYKP